MWRLKLFDQFAFILPVLLNLDKELEKLKTIYNSRFNCINIILKGRNQNFQLIASGGTKMNVFENYTINLLTALNYLLSILTIKISKIFYFFENSYQTYLIIYIRVPIRD